MSLNLIRTTFRILRAQQGQVESAKELLDESIATLTGEEPLSFEQREFLLWGLRRLRASTHDPFNINKKISKGNTSGPFTSKEVMWEVYLSVCAFKEKGHPLTLSKKTLSENPTACTLAKNYMLEEHGRELNVDTVETYYKEVDADLTRAKAVFAFIQQFENDFGEDLDKAVGLASEELSKQKKKIIHSHTLIKQSYLEYRNILIEKIDPSER